MGSMARWAPSISTSSYTTTYLTPSFTTTSKPTTRLKSLSMAVTTSCLNGPQASSIVNQFISLLEFPQAPTFNDTAGQLLADSFTDTSDSINFMANIPPGSTTFASKQAFIIGQGSQPAIPNITTLGLFWTCHQIAWRWLGQGIGSSKYEVKGINTFDIDDQAKIAAIYTEFNSAAWLADYGNPQCV